MLKAITNLHGGVSSLVQLTIGYVHRIQVYVENKANNNKRKIVFCTSKGGRQGCFCGFICKSKYRLRKEKILCHFLFFPLHSN